MNARESGIKEVRPLYFVQVEAISKIFAVIYHLYMDIHYTKKQAENNLSSCNFPFLFHVAVYLVTYLESGLCRLG